MSQPVPAFTPRLTRAAGSSLSIVLFVAPLTALLTPQLDGESPRTSGSQEPEGERASAGPPEVIESILQMQSARAAGMLVCPPAHPRPQQEGSWSPRLEAWLEWEVEDGGVRFLSNGESTVHGTWELGFHASAAALVAREFDDGSLIVAARVGAPDAARIAVARLAWTEVAGRTPVLVERGAAQVQHLLCPTMPAPDSTSEPIAVCAFDVLDVADWDRESGSVRLVLQDRATGRVGAARIPTHPRAEAPVARARLQRGLAGMALATPEFEPVGTALDGRAITTALGSLAVLRESGLRSALDPNRVQAGVHVHRKSPDGDWPLIPVGGDDVLAASDFVLWADAQGAVRMTTTTSSSEARGRPETSVVTNGLDVDARGSWSWIETHRVPLYVDLSQVPVRIDIEAERSGAPRAVLVPAVGAAIRVDLR